MTSEALSRSTQAAQELLIDAQLSQFDARNFHAVVVDTPPRPPTGRSGRWTRGR